MIRTGTDVFYYQQPVDSNDQAISLANYLQSHGQLAYPEGNETVVIPLECPRKEDAADKSGQVHTLVSCWRLFWEHSDGQLFDLPVYVKD